MLDDLRATPEVLCGALIAFVIVVLLTPAVGGMARLLGVVDQPDARRLNQRPIPRLGGLAIFLGIIVPSLAFLDLLGRDARASCSARRSRASSARSTTSAASRRCRSSPGQVARGADPDRRSASGSTTSRSRSSAWSTSRPGSASR